MVPALCSYGVEWQKDATIEALLSTRGDVGGTKVTADGVADFQKALPKVTVIR